MPLGLVECDLSLGGVDFEGLKSVELRTGTGIGPVELIPRSSGEISGGG